MVEQQIEKKAPEQRKMPQTPQELLYAAKMLKEEGNNLFKAFSNSMQNKSELKLTFFSTVFVYSNIALAIFF